MIVSQSSLKHRQSNRLIEVPDLKHGGVEECNIIPEQPPLFLLDQGEIVDALQLRLMDAKVGDELSSKLLKLADEPRLKTREPHPHCLLENGWECKAK